MYRECAGICIFTLAGGIILGGFVPLKLHIALENASLDGRNAAWVGCAMRA